MQQTWVWHKPSWRISPLTPPRSGKNTQKSYTKKNIHDPDNHNETATINMSANLENSAVATGLEKVSFYSNPKEMQCQRMLSYHTIAFISHASEEMLKILQARLQQNVNHELPVVQAEFRKGRGTKDQIDNIHWIIKKAR